ncbi:MAG: hypothetical protein FWD98_04780 [Defluviitaleaceae bacterium]|nr:hypothetical protein [Defluviitaleaceae bacterium]
MTIITGIAFNIINIALIVLLVYVLITAAKVLRKLDKALDIWLSDHDRD